jgi:integral membrane sensor domain MASE1
LSEVLAFATVTPVLLSWINGGRALMRMSRAFYLEGLILISGLILLSYVTFTHPQNLSSPTLLFSLVPFLLWSALRFGWLGISTSLIVVSCISSWAALHGTGPFSRLVPYTNPLSLQLFLVFAAVPFMVLATLAEEHEQSAHVIRESEERFRYRTEVPPPPPSRR